MCGIAGTYSLEQRSSPESTGIIAQVMSKALTHRGPDDEGIYLSLDRKLALAHRRLAIIDLSPAGRQPMTDETGRYWVIFNGEIYNYQKLRKELLREGHNFKSSSDTEVILALYAHYGLKGLERLRGMFALGLWDNARQQLLLARDPFGIKPLYYYITSKSLLFASEIRALLASGLVHRQLSLEGLASYLHYGSVQVPATIIEGVRSLLPGHYMTVYPQEGRLQVNEVPYAAGLFSENPVPPAPDRQEAAMLLGEIVKESVRLHLISDVPLGVFLSGGVDSSALVALMSRVAETKPRTFTVVFGENGFSEAQYARVVAKEFDTDHNEIPLEKTELLNMLPEALEAMDQPTMDGINTFVVSKAVKGAGVTVALSGLGGDELFAGYPSFRRVRQLQRIRSVPYGLRRAASVVGRAVTGDSVRAGKFWDLVECSCSGSAVYSISRQLFAPNEIRTLSNHYPLPPPSLVALHEDGDDPINTVSVCELQRYMPNTLLRDTDCMSMAHALEVRVPFVDPIVVQYVLRLPGAWKVDRHRPKPLLLDALSGLLPDKIWRRPKMGFTLPFDQWMRSALRAEIDDALMGEEGFERLGVHSSQVRRVWEAFSNSPGSEQWSRPWALYVLKRWCQINKVEL